MNKLTKHHKMHVMFDIELMKLRLVKLIFRLPD